MKEVNKNSIIVWEMHYITHDNTRFWWV